MEAAAKLPLSGDDNVDESNIDSKKCVLCQESKFPKKRFPLSKGTSAGTSRVLHCAGIRTTFKDDSYKQCSEIIKFLEEKGNEDVFWHRQCYSDFTNEGHLQRLQKRASDGAEPEETPSEGTGSRRSSLERMDWSKCIFCQTDIKKVALSQVQTFETSEKILSKAANDREMSCRLAGISDLIAAEGKYHLKCYTRYLKKSTQKISENNEIEDANVKCFNEVMGLLIKRLSEGHIYSIKAVWTYYCRRLAESYHLQPPPYRSNRFKERIQNVLGRSVTFVPPLNRSEPHLVVSSNLGETALQHLLKEPGQRLNLNQESCDDELVNDAIEDVDLDAELLSWLYRVSVKVHHDVKSVLGHDCIGKINQASAEKIVPESLFMLISLLCTGHQEEEKESDIDMKPRILSICQDILFLASRGRKLTPKHVGLGLTVHQATRSKELVQLLYNSGHSISYETVLRMDNTLANDVLERYKENGNVFVPRNFAESSNRISYTRYAVDNIDINEETLSGMGTFHATQVAALRRKVEGEPAVDIQVTPKSERRLDVHVPSELHELSELCLENKKPEPKMEGTVTEEWYDPDINKINESYKKELAWILSRLAHQQPELQKIPGWSGFNQLLSTDESQVTIVGPLPIVNAPAHEFETLWTVILRCKAMTRVRNGKYTVVTMDEGLYYKAKMLQWEKTEEFKNVIFILGGFHTQMTFTKVIGKYLESSGMSDIWAESEVFGENTAGNILKGKLWNRVLRAHKLSYEALWRVLWPLLIKWAEEKGGGVDKMLEDLSAKLAIEFTSGEDNPATDATACSSLLSEVGQVVFDHRIFHTYIYIYIYIYICISICHANYHR